MTKLPTIRRSLNEQGFASIVIALVLIVVLALLTVGFAQLARREQQDALKKQLATEANYAAETGINDAYKDITNGLINDSNSSSTKCMTKTGVSGATQTGSLPSAAHTTKSVIDASRDISYTCVLVSLHTKDLRFDNVSDGSGRHMAFSTSATPDTLTISWGSANQHNTFRGAGSSQFLPSSAWHDSAGHPYPPVIQFSITPLSTATRQAYIGGTFNAYLYPSSGASGSASVGSAQGQILSGGCNTANSATYPCNVTLTGLTGNNFLIHFTDTYDASNILITGANGGSKTGVTFTGEPLIDVTGKAKNVLKRLQARLFTTSGTNGSIDNGSILPNNAIEAQNICKRIGAAPSGPDNPLGSTFDTGTSEEACNLAR